MSNEGYHEPIHELTGNTREMHRAITSLMEELEAIDWYNQRVNASGDQELQQILSHNQDEEKEHAAIPEIVAGSEILFSDTEFWFLFKRQHSAVVAPLDVAVSCFWNMRFDPKCYKTA